MSGERDGQPGTAGLTIRTSTSSFNLGRSQSSRLSGNAKEEGLDVTLDDLAVQHTQIGLDEWSDASADSSRRWITSWTARTSRNRQVKTIPKAENTPEHEYDQAKCLSIITGGYIADKTKGQALGFQRLESETEVWGYRGQRIGTSWSQLWRLM